MNHVVPATYRAAPPTLRAEWIIEEADLHAAAKMLPGSTLSLLRWPVVFFIAYVACALPDPRVGPVFALGSGAVIALAWIILSLGSRGTELRKMARLPHAQRATRLTIDAERIRHETAGTVADLAPTELTHARLGSKGVLLRIRKQALFVPMRAVAGDERAWRAFVAAVPARAWPTKVGLTTGLWLVALAFAAYHLHAHGR